MKSENTKQRRRSKRISRDTSSSEQVSTYGKRQSFQSTNDVSEKLNNSKSFVPWLPSNEKISKFLQNPIREKHCRKCYKLKANLKCELCDRHFHHNCVEPRRSYEDWEYDFCAKRTRTPNPRYKVRKFFERFSNYSIFNVNEMLKIIETRLELESFLNEIQLPVEDVAEIKNIHDEIKKKLEESQYESMIQFYLDIEKMIFMAVTKSEESELYNCWD